jgi:hypothetical protein
VKRFQDFFSLLPNNSDVAQMQHSSEKVLESAYRRSPAIVQAMLPTAYAYMYLYLAVCR